MRCWPRNGLRLVTLALFMVLAACGSGQADWGNCPTEGCEGSLDPSVEYTASHLLEVHSPVEIGPWPTVLLAHGSGQNAISMRSLAEAITSEGFVVFNITAPTRAPYLKTVEHIACAVLFARRYTSQYGGSADNITLAGYSLGAAMGSVVGLGGDGLSGDCVVAEGSSEPDAFVGYEGPYDLALTTYEIDPAILESDEPDVWAEINPYVRIGGNADLTVRLVHGIDQDRSVYDVVPEVTRDFGAALASAGYDVEVVILDGATHGDAYRPSTEAFETMTSLLTSVAYGR